MASPETAGRTTIVGKKLVVILGQKKAVAIMAGTCQGGGDGRSWRSVSALVHRRLRSERHYADGAAFGS